MTWGRLGPSRTPRKWAERLVAQLDSATREGLRTDPARAIPEHLGLTVVERDDLGERGDGGWCDGMSITEKGVIFYAPTDNSKRENFTLDHEVGHYLVDNDTDETTLDWAADLPERPKVIEQVCNIVASRLLLPEEEVRGVLGATGPGGDAVALLEARSEASREVCAIAVAERLPCDGFVALVNLRTSVVTFAARAGQGRPYPRRDEPVPTGHPMLRLDDGESAASESWWPWPDRNPRRYYQHATRSGQWVYAVLADNDLWNAATFHAPIGDRPAVTVPERRMTCPCGYVGTARGFPCSTCKQISCPRCHECDCVRKDRQPRAFCDGCFVSFPVAQLKDGFCSGCR